MNETEYALMIDWEDGAAPEFIPAKDVAHADHMAATIYKGRNCWTVGREILPWRYVSRSTPELTSALAG